MAKATGMYLYLVIVSMCGSLQFVYISQVKRLSSLTSQCFD